MTSDTDIYADPAEVVRQFIAAMNAWELRQAVEYRAAKKSGFLPTAEEHRASLAAVFDRWCTPKERKFGRLGSFSMPPEYDPEYESILETIHQTKSRAHVMTQRARGFKEKRMYVLLKKDERWLIDSAKWCNHQGDWKATTL